MSANAAKKFHVQAIAVLMNMRFRPCHGLNALPDCPQASTELTTLHAGMHCTKLIMSWILLFCHCRLQVLSNCQKIN